MEVLMTMRYASRSAAMAVAMAMVLASCSQPSESVNKSGGDTVVLHLATIDSVNPNGQYFGSEEFVNALEDVSGGRLKVEVENDFGDREPDAESKLVEAIASGAIDGGAPSTRAFANAGIPGLEVVEAPMTITSFEAQKALVTGSVADELLGRLEGSGVVGLGLAVGPLRRPFAAEAPLLGPDDWEGARFRVFNSPIQAEAVRALGGEPINLGIGWIDEVEAGNLRGAELDIAQYWANGFTTEAANVTANVVLWPKVIVLSLSQRRWDSLTGDQQQWVREAAQRAVQASIDATYDESTPAQALCDKGVRFVDANPGQVAALRQSLAPVLAGMGADPQLAEIQAIASQYPDPAVLDIAAECRQVLPVDPMAMDPIPDEVSALPDGSYRVDITVADVEAAGIGNGPGWTGTWTLTIDNGTYVLTCRPLDLPGRDCGNFTYGDTSEFDLPLDAGFVRGQGDSIFFIYDADVFTQVAPEAGDPTIEYVYQLTWSLDGDTLTFSDLRGGEAADKWIKPWTRIG
jgi:TRAP-type C4-dicarboxylate transport system substrate-binding protein